MIYPPNQVNTDTTIGTVLHLGAVREIIGVGEKYDALGRILLLGEDNPQSSAPEHALVNHPDGCAGHRLQSRVLEIVPSTYHAIWRTNLCSPVWFTPDAKNRFWSLLAPDAPWTTVVCLGRKVSSIAELDTWAGRQIDTGGREFSVISLPHPSGRCREWNDPSSYGRAHRLMRLVAPAIPWGGVML